MRTLLLSSSARRDVAEIAEYISGVAGPAIATEVIIRIREKCVLRAETVGDIAGPLTD